jgi:hypothetical protein
MTCGGSHLGFPMIIPEQFGFNYPSGFLYKVSVFHADRKLKMAATAGHRLTLDSMGKCSNAFFSEATNTQSV